MTGISWNLAALSKDAQAWTCVSDRLEKAAELLNEATLTQGDFMSFLDNSAPAHTAMTTAVSTIQALAKGGAERTAQGAQVLREVRDAYQADEEKARQIYDGLWLPDSD